MCPKQLIDQGFVVIGSAILCLLAGSGTPAFAFAIAWVPNYPLLGAAMVGAIRLPRLLEPVGAREAALYRWVGVGLVQFIVTGRNGLLERIELVTKGAEICHGRLDSGV
jgi:hypothetical protein